MVITNTKFASSFLLRHRGVSDARNMRWSDVLNYLKNEYGEKKYISWFQNLEFDSICNSVVILLAPTVFVQNYVCLHYSDSILKIWRKLDDSVRKIEIKVCDSQEINTRKKIIALSDTSSILNTYYRFERFVTGKSNELAFAASKQISSLDNALNPFFIYGEVGLGKTHLMHAIGWDVKNKMQNKRVMYMSAERFMCQYVNAIKENEIIKFRQDLRSVDVLMIDDIQFISDKTNTQEEFFHTFNSLVENGKQLIISADRAPGDLSGIKERIQSRLNGGLTVEVHPPTFELRLGILQKKLEYINSSSKSPVNIPEDVLSLIADKVTYSVRDLEGALNKLIACSTLLKRDINIHSASEVLHDMLFSERTKRITIDKIKSVVSVHYKIREIDLVSKRRQKHIVRARQVAIHMCKLFTDLSLKGMAREFHKKDHTAILYSLKKVKRLAESDDTFESEIEIISRKLNS